MYRALSRLHLSTRVLVRLLVFVPLLASTARASGVPAHHSQVPHRRPAVSGTADLRGTGRPLVATAPALVPPANATGVSPTSAISAQYADPTVLQPSSVTARSFPVYGNLTGQIGGTYGTLAGLMSLRPARPFHPGELLSAIATTRTVTTGGQHPDRPTIWQFQTAAAGGTGHFMMGPVLGALDATGIATGDLKHDGKMDVLLVHGAAGTPDLWRNDGTGSFFNDITQSWPASLLARAVALGDLNGDGYLDAVFLTAGHPALWVFFNDGTGHFVPDGSGIDLEPAHRVILGDINGDGMIDALVLNNQAPAVRVWLNNGQGHLQARSSFGATPTPLYTEGVLQDLRGAGVLDAVVVNEQAMTADIWRNDGLGTFTPAGSVTARGVHHATLGDVDGDGMADLVLSTDSGLQVLANRGDGTFAYRATYPVTPAGAAVGLADVQGRGVLDMVTEGQVLLNDANGTGTFGPLGAGPGPVPSGDVAFVDMNGDGGLDALLTGGTPLRGQLWPASNAETVAFDRSWLQRQPDGTYGQPLPPPAERTSINVRIARSGDRSQALTLLAVVDNTVNPVQTTYTVTFQPHEAFTTITIDVGPLTEGGSLKLVTISSVLVGTPAHIDLLVYPQSFVPAGTGCWVCYACSLEQSTGCVACTNSGSAAATSASHPQSADLTTTLSSLRDQVMSASPQGQYYSTLYRRTSPDVITMLLSHPGLVGPTWNTLTEWQPGIQSLVSGQGATVTVSQQMIDDLVFVLDQFKHQGGASLSALIQQEEDALNLPSFVGLSMAQAYAQAIQRITVRPLPQSYLPVVTAKQ